LLFLSINHLVSENFNFLDSVIVRFGILILVFPVTFCSFIWLEVFKIKSKKDGGKWEKKVYEKWKV
jgi:hypothetical protein